MKKTYKYRISGNNEALLNADNWLTLCRHLYNAALEQRIVIYRQNKGKISCYDQSKQLPELKVDFPEYKEVGSQTLQDVIERLDKAYQGFFRRVRVGDKAGFPRFRNKDRYNSFTLKQAGWKLDGKYIIIKNIGTLKIMMSRPIEGYVKTVTIQKEDYKWYVSFSCIVDAKILPYSDKEIGIDVGLESFAVLSDNTLPIQNPRFMKEAEAILIKAQRRVSRRKKGGSNRRKAVKLLAKHHTKVRNQRKDFAHKLSRKIVNEYGYIAVEDLNVKGMMQNHYLAKGIGDAAWGMFLNFTAYKAEEAGRFFVKINPSGTSQICSGCGAEVPKSLADRIHNCPICGIIMSRDLNSAYNILALGRRVWEPTWHSSACVSQESPIL